MRMYTLLKKIPSYTIQYNELKGLLFSKELTLPFEYFFKQESFKKSFIKINELILNKMKKKSIIVLQNTKQTLNIAFPIRRHSSLAQLVRAHDC
jgi:hypothetical protein